MGTSAKGPGWATLASFVAKEVPSAPRSHRHPVFMEIYSPARHLGPVQLITEVGITTIPAPSLAWPCLTCFSREQVVSRLSPGLPSRAISGQGSGCRWSFPVKSPPAPWTGDPEPYVPLGLLSGFLGLTPGSVRSSASFPAVLLGKSPSTFTSTVTAFSSRQAFSFPNSSVLPFSGWPSVRLQRRGYGQWCEM